MLPGNSEVPKRPRVGYAALEDSWDQSVTYFEQALALDPRNMALVTEAAWTYTMLRQFPSRAKARRSSAGHYAKRSRCEGVKGQYLSGTG